jgi:TP901 family phage tail tape measure protein
MSNRTVKVVLEAEVAKYLANVDKAAKAATDAGKAAEDAGKKIDQAQETAAKSTDKSTDANKKHSESGKESAKGSDESAAAAKKDAEYKEKQAEATKTAGTALLAFGTATVAALGASAKAAMDWESAWAGVTKTVDGSPAQMAELEGGLRQLAKTLPSTHTEIAAVAEAAGQLGVKREDILKFTKTMIDLGETTNLTAEEAATNIAQIANVMGTSGDDIDNFGATLVALGNDGASTEKEILSMAQRIAGAGKLVGASESDVLALSNTLASMGVNAELGGGVTTRVLLKMYSAVQGGGKKMEAFAKAAGTSAEDFAKAFRESPVAALEMVTKGMARTKEEGGNVVAMMADMGMKGTEEMQVMLSLAGAGNLLSDSLKLGSKAWEENTALINEASKRYETTESKVKVAWNNIKDAAIDAGAVMLPVIQGVAENVTGLAQTFGNLPAPLQGAVTGLGGVVGAAALAGGGLMLLLPKVKDGIDAFNTLNTRADGSSRGLGKLGKAAGIAAGAFMGFEILKAVHNSMQTGAVSTEQMTQNLLKLAKQKDSMDTAFKDLGVVDSWGGKLENAGQAMKKLVKQDFNDAVSSFGATVLGIDNGMAKISAAFEKSDQAIAGAVGSGNMDIAAHGFKAIADSAKDQGVEVEETAKRFPNYLNALRDLANQHKVNVSEADLLKWAMGEVPPEMEKVAGGASKAAAGLTDVKSSAGGTITVTKEVAKALEELGITASGQVINIDKFTQALLNTGLLQLSARDASRGWSQALLDLGLNADGTGGQIGKLGTAFDNTTEQGIKNQAMFDGVAQAGMRNVQAMAKNQASNEEVQGALQGTYDGLIAAAGQFGITGDAAVDLARDVLGVPKGVNITSWMSDEARRMAQATTGELDKIDGRVVTARSVMIEETHRINYEKRVVESGGNEPDGGGLYGSDRRAAGGAILKRAGGGSIYGPGTSTSDEVPIMASAGEHMLDRGDVIKMGGQPGVYKFRKALQAGQLDGLAGGGSVGQATSSRLIASSSVMPPTVSLEGLTVLVTNPFTGEQVRGIVTSVARQEAAGAISAADAQAQNMRTGRR